MNKNLVQLAFCQTNILRAEVTVLNVKLDCIVFQYVQCGITNVHNAYNIRIVLNFRVSVEEEAQSFKLLQWEKKTPPIYENDLSDQKK